MKNQKLTYALFLAFVQVQSLFAQSDRMDEKAYETTTLYGDKAYVESLKGNSHIQKGIEQGAKGAKRAMEFMAEQKAPVADTKWGARQFGELGLWRFTADDTVVDGKNKKIELSGKITREEIEMAKLICDQFHAPGSMWQRTWQQQKTKRDAALKTIDTQISSLTRVKDDAMERGNHPLFEKTSSEIKALEVKKLRLNLDSDLESETLFRDFSTHLSGSLKVKGAVKSPEEWQKLMTGFFYGWDPKNVIRKK